MIEWRQIVNPEDPNWIEYHAETETHYSKVWVNFMGNWQAVVIDKSDGMRGRYMIDPNTEQNAKATCEYIMTRVVN